MKLKEYCCGQVELVVFEAFCDHGLVRVIEPLDKTDIGCEPFSGLAVVMGTRCDVAFWDPEVVAGTRDDPFLGLAP